MLYEVITLDVMEEQTGQMDRLVKRTALYTQTGGQTPALLDAFKV